MKARHAKPSSAIQTKALPIANRMLALEPRYVFDAAIASEMHSIVEAEARPEQAEHVPQGIGAKMVAAARSLFWGRETAEEAPTSRAVEAPVETLDRAIMSYVDAHNLAPSNHEIAFIDSRLADLGTLVTAVPDGTRIVLIDGARDGVQQMAEALAGENGITGVHIISHGQAGQISLGNGTINADTMASTYRDALATIGSHLSAEADILVYGCSFAAGDAGARAVQMLAGLTGADVAASEDLTGAGGDWDLERREGSVEVTAVATRSYDAALADTNTGTWTVSGLSASNTTDGVTTTITFAPGAGTNFSGIANQTFNNLPSAFTNSAAGGASLSFVYTWDTTPESATGLPLPLAATDAGTGTVSITFSVPVTDPIIYLDRLGGFGGYQQTDAFGNIIVEENRTNSSIWTLTTPGATLVELAGVSHFDTTATTIQRTPGVVVPYTGTSTESGVDSSLNAAGGTVQVIGTYTSITFSLTGVGVEGAGADGVELRFAVDAPPAAIDDAFTMNEDSTLTGNLFANNGTGADSDPTSDVLTITEINGTAITAGTPITLSNGTLTITNASTGAFTFTPNANYVGSQAFSYTIADPNGSTDTATVSITINDVSDVPDAVNDGPYSVIPGVATNITVLANDTDPDGDALTVSQINGTNIAVEGSVTLASGTVITRNADGTLGVVMAPGSSDFETFVYQISDGNGGTASATVTLARDTDSDGVANTNDIDDDNDGILDVIEGYVETENNPNITANGYVIDAIQGGYHGALYQLAGGGYAITGVGAQPGGSDLLTLTRISDANGYPRGDEIVIGAYGGSIGGAIFVLENGDYATLGYPAGLTTLNGDVTPSGWHVYTTPGTHPGFPPSVTSVDDIVSLRATGSSYSAGGILTMLDKNGQLWYNGQGGLLLGLPTGNENFSASWEAFPPLPGGAKVLQFDVTAYKTVYSHAFVYADDGNYYTLGNGIYKADGTTITNSAAWQLVAPPTTGAPAQIATNGHTYYVLDANGTMHTMGNNYTNGLLGLGISTPLYEQTTWTVVGTGTAGGPLTNVAYISTVGNETSFLATSVILKDGTLRSWGSNVTGLIGSPTLLDQYEPIIPDTQSPLVFNNVAYVENAGRFTPVIQNNVLYNVGEGLGGGFGDGTTATRFEYSSVAMPSGLNTVAAQGPLRSIDTDQDGLADHVDIDSDDDGIVDNIEGQLTVGYVAPSGVGAAMLDADNDGLDDRYDTTLNGGALGSNGVLPVNTDAGATTPDALHDWRDLDSDNDGLSDNAENGLAVPFPAPLAADADVDGLKDVYEMAIDGAINDGFVVNEGVTNPLSTTGSYLPDADLDAAGAAPLSRDLDYRDAVTNFAPVVNLDPNNSGGGADDGNYNVVFTEGQPDVAVTLVDADSIVSDGGASDIVSMQLTLSGVVDGDNEVLTIAGHSFPLGTSVSAPVVVALDTGRAAILYDASSHTFVISNADVAGAPLTAADYTALLQVLRYRDAGEAPSAGDRSLTVTVTDQGGLTSAPVSSIITVIDVNDAPVVTLSAVAPGDVVVIDMSLPDAATLLDSVPAGARIVQIPQGTPGIATLAHTLAGFSDIGALHILSHGTSGQLNLGSDLLTASSIAGQYAADLASIGAKLGANGDILVYGCEFGADMSAVDALAGATGADIAASSDDTGAAAQGGDWSLEVIYGAIEAQLMQALAYPHLLAPQLTSLNFGSPAVEFNNPAGLIGDQWRYTAVAPGVDAIVEIVDVTGSTTSLANIDGSSSGRLSAFQPEITGKPADGSAISFQVRFVETGTTTPTTVTNFVANGIDVDGAGASTQEMATWQSADTVYIEPGSQLNLDTPAPNPTIHGTQTGFPGVDVEQTVANYSIFYAAPVSELNFSIGMAGSGTSTTTRLSSISFAPADLEAYDSPVAVPDYASTLGNTPVTFQILDNDWGGEEGPDGSRAETPIDLASVDLDPATPGRQTTFTVAGQGAFVYNGDGTVTFTPEPGFSGDVTPISYTVDNTITAANPAIETSNVGAIRVTVEPAPNDPPAIVAPGFSTPQDAPVPLTGISFSDPDVGTGDVTVTLSIGAGTLDILDTVAGGLTAGQISGDGTGTITLTGPIDAINATLAAANGLVYTPPPGVDTDQTLDITIDDLGGTGSGGPLNDTASVPIVITASNAPPVLVDPAPGVPGSPEIDPANPLNLLVPVVDNVPMRLAAGDYFADPNGDPLTITPDMIGVPSWLSYDPATQTFAGTPPVDNAGADIVIPVMVDDGKGGTFPGTITIQATNPPPDAVDDTVTTPFETPVVVDLLGNDTDPDTDPLTVTSAALADPTTGTLTQDPTTLAWTFTPAPGFSGDAVINYTITDQDGATDSAIHTVTVENAPPKLVDPDPTPDTPFIDPADPGKLVAPAIDGVPMSVPLNQYFADPNGDPLTFTPDMTGVPSWVTFDPTTNTFSGTPPSDNTGPVSIPVLASDGKGGVYAATIVITPTNPAPDAVDDTSVASPGVPVVVPLLGNDTDPDNDPLVVMTATLADPTTGTLVQDPTTLAWTFTPAPGFSGDAVINYTITDQDGATDSAIHTVTVGNAPPVLVDPAPGDSLSPEIDPTNPSNLLVPVIDDVPMTLPAADYFSDPNGDPLTITPDMTGVPSWLTYDPATQTFSGTPPADNPAGDIVIPVLVDDGNGGTYPATITIQATNPPPVAVTDSTTTSAGTPVVVDLLGNDTDPDNDPLVVTTATLADPTQGTLVQDPATLAWTFTPAPGFSGTATINYTITDQDGATSASTHNVVVGNAPPVLVDPTPGDPLSPEIDSTDPSNLLVPAEDGVPLTLPLADYFTDPNGDPLTITPDAGDIPSWLSYDPVTQTFTGTPPADNTDPVVIDVMVDDGNGGTYPATITIQPTNPAPDAVDDTTTTDPETPVVVDLLGNDTDPDSDPLTVTSATLADPTTGTLTQDPTTLAWTFTPAPGFSGDAVINYTITDQDGATDTAIHTVAVGPVLNEPPTLVDADPTPGTPSIDPTDPSKLIVPAVDGKPLTLPLAEYFTDPNEDTLTITPDPTAIPSWLTYDPVTQTFTGIPPADNTGPVTIPVLVDDGKGGTYASTVVIMPENPPPDAVDGGASTMPETPVVLDLLGNDTDPDGDLLTVVSATLADPTTGTLTQDPVTGAWTFTPAPGFSGPAVINYTIQDQDGATDSAQHIVDVPVVEPNNPPVLIDPVPGVPGTPEVDPTNPANLLVPAVDGEPLVLPAGAYFTDVDGDPLTITPDPTAIPLWLTYDPVTQTFTGTPPADNTGPVTIPVTVTDGNGGSFVGSIVIQPANPGPDAVDDSTTTDPDTPVVVGLLANDIDPDGDPLNVTSATLADPTTGTLTQDPVTGAWTFTPAPGFAGDVVINYTIADQDGATDSALHTVTVGNAPPDLVDPDLTPGTPFVDPTDPGKLVAPAIDGVPVSVPLNQYFADPNGDPLNFTPDMTNVPSWVVWDPTTNTFSGTPPADNTGPVSIPVLASDGKGGVYAATIVITPTNPGPDAVDDSTTTGFETPVVVDLLVNDTDPDGDPLTVVSASVPPAQGTVALVGGNWVFTPAPGFSGTATITYTIADQDGAIDSAAHTVDVANAPPDLVDPDLTPGTPFVDPTDPGKLVAPAIDGVPVSVPLNQYFADPNGDPLTFTPDMTNVPSWVVWDPVTKTFSGTPPADNTGPVSIPVLASDGKGGVYAATIVITPSNPAPDAVVDSSATPHNTPVVVDLLDNDTDPDGDPLNVTSATLADPSSGTLTQDPVTGAWTFSPAPSFTGTATINYTITDQDGATDTATHTVTVAAPARPVAINDQYTVAFGSTLDGSVTGNDTFVPGSTFSVLSQPMNGTLEFQPDGTYTFTPAPGFAGTETFVYQVTDPTGQTALAIEVIRVTPPQIVAVSDSYTTPFNTALNGNVTLNDTFAQGSTFFAITAPVNGTVAMNADGTYVYTPKPGFVGVDIFAYAVTDPSGQTRFATDTISVSPPPGPIAVDDNYATGYRTPVSGSAGTGDTYSAGSTFAATSQPTHGTLVFNADGTYTYTPAAGFAGVDTFTYRVTDANGQTATAVERITVAAPTLQAVDDAYAGVYGTPVIGNAATGDTFAPGSLFGVEIVPAHGTVTMNAGGTYSYTPAAGFTGTDTFTYRVTDPTGQSTIATETITIRPPAVVAVDDTVNTMANTPVNGNAANGDTFAPGSTFSVAAPPSVGTVAMNPDGTYRYTPPANFSGTVTFTYQVTDPTGQTRTAVETIVVSRPQLIAVSDSYATPYNTALSGNAAAGDTYAPGSAFAAVSSPSNGSLQMNADGTYQYLPFAGFSGTDTFTYSITDPSGQTVTATETITVGARPAVHRCLTTFGQLNIRR